MTTPNTPPPFYLEAVTYDTYFDNAGNPIDFDEAVERVAERSAADVRYHSAARYAETHDTAETWDVGTRGVAARGRRQVIEGIGDALAGDSYHYHDVSEELRNGRIYDRDAASMAREVLDGRQPALRHPYPPAEEPTPYQNFREGHENEHGETTERWIQEALAIIDDPAISDADRQSMLIGFAHELQLILREDPSQITAIQRTLANLERNANVAGGKLNAATRRAAGARNEHLEVRARERTDVADLDPVTIEPPAGLAGAITPPPVGSTESDKKAHFARERERLLQATVGGPMMRRLQRNRVGDIKRYVAQCEDASMNLGRRAGRVALRLSLETTGADGVRKHTGFHDADSTRLERYRELLATVHELSDDADPHVLQERYSRLLTERQEANNPQAFEIDQEAVGEYQQALDRVLLTWRQNDTPNNQYAVFRTMHQLRRYLGDVRLAIDNMSPQNTRLPRLQTLHDILNEMSNHASYQELVQRNLHAANRAGGSDHDNRGRTPVRYTMDGGVYMEGSTDVYYPNGLTAQLTDHGNGVITVDSQRRDARGEVFDLHNADEATRRRFSIDGDIRGPQAGDLASYERQYARMADQWFLDPTETNRAQAQVFAHAVYAEAFRMLAAARAANADVQNYRDDPALLTRLNAAIYTMNYHSVQPGQAPTGDARWMRYDGAVVLPNTTYGGHTGRWNVYPDGTAVQYHSDGVTVIRGYRPDGTPF